METFKAEVKVCCFKDQVELNFGMHLWLRLNNQSINIVQMVLLTCKNFKSRLLKFELHNVLSICKKKRLWKTCKLFTSTSKSVHLCSRAIWLPTFGANWKLFTANLCCFWPIMEWNEVKKLYLLGLFWKSVFFPVNFLRLKNWFLT